LIQRGTGEISSGSLGAFAPELAEAFVTVSSDIALVVDLDGTIRSVAVGADSPTPTAASWVGRSWVDTVTEQTRRKIVRMLDEVTVTGVARRCEVSHLLPSGVGVPIAYSAVRLGPTGPVVAAGRDLRAIAAIQQRFVQGQQQMERELWKRRESESRYRLLFQVATDPVLIVDAGSMTVNEVNPAAAERFGETPAALAGRGVALLFEADSWPVVADLFERARAGSRSDEVRARLIGSGDPVEVVASRFPSGDRTLLRVRMRAAQDRSPQPEREDPLAAAGTAADPHGPAIAITDTGGRVLMTNAPFTALVGLDLGAVTDEHSLGEWLSDWPAILADVRRNGFMQLVASRLTRSSGEVTEVSVSCALLSTGEDERFGFTLRPLEAAAA
jgi:transcriptional regulator PpsR